MKRALLIVVFLFITAPAFAVRIVQSKTASGTSGDQTITFDTTTTAGNLIVVVVNQTSTTGGLAIPNTPTNFTFVIQGYGSITPTMRTSIYYRANAPATSSVYVSAAAVADFSWTIIEIANALTASVVDNSAWGRATGGFLAYSTESKTTAATNEILIVGATINASGATVDWVNQANRGKVGLSTVTVGARTHVVGYSVQASSGATLYYGDAVQSAGASVHSAGAIVAFKGYAEPLGPSAGVTFLLGAD